MTIRNSIGTVAGCVLMGACFGGSLGFGLAIFAPGYYRTVFRNPNEPQFDPTDIGVGLGLIQGTALGTVVGLVLVTVLCWQEIRRSQSSATTSQLAGPARQSAGRRVLKITVSLLALGFCLACGLMVGLLLGESQAYHRRYLEEQEVLAAAIADEAAFGNIQIYERSNGGAYLIGELPSQPDFERLRIVVGRAVGEKWASQATVGVYVRDLR